MEQDKINKCQNCGFLNVKLPKEKKIIDGETDVICNVCQIVYKYKDTKTHKLSNSHYLKCDLIKKLKLLNIDDEEDRKQIEGITKLLIPKFRKQKDTKKEKKQEGIKTEKQ